MGSKLWLALRHGSVTIRLRSGCQHNSLWLALRHGSVTIRSLLTRSRSRLWLALRHGSVTMRQHNGNDSGRLWLALRHGSVTIPSRSRTCEPGVVACTQARISYNFGVFRLYRKRVVACTQARISYNQPSGCMATRPLWLALRHGSVTIEYNTARQYFMLWLALRHGSVTISLSASPVL